MVSETITNKFKQVISSNDAAGPQCPKNADGILQHIFGFRPFIRHNAANAFSGFKGL